VNKKEEEEIASESEPEMHQTPKRTRERRMKESTSKKAH
jgi:hypothetical protein